MKNKLTLTPNHVAIVPDGNRRWAKRNGLKPWEGHKEGANMIENIVKETLKLDIKNLTFWGSSEDNLKKRPLQERKELLRIYEQYFKKLISSEEVFEKKARINVVGKWMEQFPSKLIKVLKEGIEKTKNHSNFFLNFLLAYNGSSDMLAAVKKIADIYNGGEEIENIAAETIKKYLMTSQLPDVDLVIRTGVSGDPHNSAGFLMWQTQNTQYYFSSKMFPEFGVAEFNEAIEDFSFRARRMGG